MIDVILETYVGNESYDYMLAISDLNNDDLVNIIALIDLIMALPME